MAPLFPVPDGWFKAALDASRARDAGQVKPYDGRPFPFLQLPREIRDVIYEHALVMPRATLYGCEFYCPDCARKYAIVPALGSPVPIRLTLVADFRGVSEEGRRITVTTDDSCDDNRARRPPPRLTTHPPCFHLAIHSPLAAGLLAVSRQLSAEALPVLYGLNVFAGCPRTIHHFLSTISPHAAPLIRTLHVWGLEPPSPPLHLNPTLAIYPRSFRMHLPPRTDDADEQPVRLPKRRAATTWNAGYRARGEPRVLQLHPAATGVRQLGLVFCEERLVGGRARAEGIGCRVDAREAARVVCAYAGAWAEAWVRREGEERGKDEAVAVEQCVGGVVGVLAGPGDYFGQTEFEEGVFREELGALVRRELARRRGSARLAV